jgi:hypothetical protein
VKKPDKKDLDERDSELEEPGEKRQALIDESNKNWTEEKKSRGLDDDDDDDDDDAMRHQRKRRHRWGFKLRCEIWTCGK